MFNCENCKNNVICKQKVEAESFLKELNSLKEKYRDFCGTTTTKCNFFVVDTVQRNTTKIQNNPF